MSRRYLGTTLEEDISSHLHAAAEGTDIESLTRTLAQRVKGVHSKNVTPIGGLTRRQVKFGVIGSSIAVMFLGFCTFVWAMQELAVYSHIPHALRASPMQIWTATCVMGLLFCISFIVLLVALNTDTENGRARY